jgi:hypothetical protein
MACCRNAWRLGAKLAPGLADEATIPGPAAQIACAAIVPAKLPSFTAITE